MIAVTQQNLWGAVRDLPEERKQQVYNFAITLKEADSPFAPISDEQMLEDIQKSEVQIRQGKYKPYKESLANIKKELGF